MSGRTPQERIGLEVLVTIVPQGGLPHLGKTSNLSPSGMLLEIAEPLETGEHIEVKLFLPGTPKRIELTGEVTRDAGAAGENHRYGVRFLDVTKEHAADIEHFHASRLRRSGRTATT
jgi:hypothetical protein